MSVLSTPPLKTPVPQAPPPRRTAAGVVRSTTDYPSTDRQFQRQAITEHLLTALEDVVWRYRALSGHPEHADLYAETVTAEVAHQLALARRALDRHPSVG
ncbi:MAG: hypothetical protein QOD82_33 [Pseudonocardiales bacterium]|nr:hypothetical protein [Pseudonocardiales bacterium]